MSFSLALEHRFPSIHINVKFKVPSPGVIVLFGPSGAGKSTIINTAAGLLRPDICRITVDNFVLADTTVGLWLPPEQRRIGLVFQDARLFPHMSVQTNLRFGLRRAVPGSIGFEEVIDLLGLGALLNRRPHSLSGGERQRVAIGRALLAQPRLLLMDEPLASLDQARKAEIIPYLTRLKTALRLPILYVTHALDEATQLADHMVLMESGQAVAFGAISDIVARADFSLAQRDDAGALLICHVEGHDADRGLTRLASAGVVFWVPLLDLPVTGRCRIRIPAREVILASQAPEAISLHNIIAGTVRQLVETELQRSIIVEISLPNGALLARVTSDAVTKLSLSPGVPVLALIKSTSIEVLDG